MNDLKNGIKEIIGDEYITLGNDPWSQKYIDGFKNGPLGTTAQAWMKCDVLDIKNTYYYRWAVNNYFRKGLKLWKYSNQEDFCNEVIRLYKLFISIRDKGYDEYSNCLYEERYDEQHDMTLTSGPIQANILADGTFDFTHIPDGHHRVCILAALGKPIKVMVQKRHEDWNNLRIDLYNMWKRKYLYTPIPHPDFSSWEVGHGGVDRFNAIAEYIRKNNKDMGKNVLDVGCHFGYFLYYLWDKKLIETGCGVDFGEVPSKVASLILSKIGMKFEKKDVLNFFKNNETDFSLIIATSMVYHLFDLYSLEQINFIFSKIKQFSPCFIFDTAPINPKWPDEIKKTGFVDFVKKSTGYSCCENIGKDSEYNRDIWALSN